MSENADELKTKLSLLPPRERAELAYFLIRSLDEEVDADWAPWWSDELSRRRSKSTTEHTRANQPTRCLANSATSMHDRECLRRWHVGEPAALFSGLRCRKVTPN